MQYFTNRKKGNNTKYIGIILLISSLFLVGCKAGFMLNESDPTKAVELLKTWVDLLYVKGDYEKYQGLVDDNSKIYANSKIVEKAITDMINDAGKIKSITVESYVNNPVEKTTILICKSTHISGKYVYQYFRFRRFGDKYTPFDFQLRKKPLNLGKGVKAMKIPVTININDKDLGDNKLSI